MIRSLPVLLACTVLAGCAATVSKERALRLEPGMNMVQASAVLGAPADIQRDGTREAWRYCIDDILVDHYLVAWFDHGKVVGSTNARDYDRGACEGEMAAFSWDDAPQPEG